MSEVKKEKRRGYPWAVFNHKWSRCRILPFATLIIVAPMIVWMGGGYHQRTSRQTDNAHQTFLARLLNEKDYHFNSCLFFPNEDRQLRREVIFEYFLLLSLFFSIIPVYFIPHDDRTHLNPLPLEISNCIQLKFFSHVIIIRRISI